MNKFILMNRAILSLAVGSWLSCVPGHLSKYQGKQAVEETSPLREPLAIPSSAAADSKPLDVKLQKQATIFAIDNQTFKFMLRGDKVWEAAIDLLLRNYNLTIVDRESGIITTEWDSFFLDSKVFRNRISLRVRRIGSDQTELMIFNNVESLRDGAGATGSVWLPAEDRAGETVRLVQNLALILKEPPPVLPPGMVASAVQPATPATNY